MPRTITARIAAVVTALVLAATGGTATAATGDEEPPVEVTVAAPEDLRIVGAKLFVPGDSFSVKLRSSEPSGTAVLEWRDGSGTWRDTSRRIEFADGRGFVRVSPPNTRTFRARIGTVVSETLTVVEADARIELGSPRTFHAKSSATFLVRLRPSITTNARVDVRDPGGEWSTTIETVRLRNGMASFTRSPSRTREFRVVVGDVSSPVVTVTPLSAYQPDFDMRTAYPSGYYLESAVSDVRLSRGEALTMLGRALKNGASAGRVYAYLETADSPDGPWTRIRKERANSGGYLEFDLRPESSAHYRIVLASSLTADPRAVSLSQRTRVGNYDRTLSARAKALAWTLGSPTRSVRTVTGTALSRARGNKDIQQLRWRSYRNGTLVETTNSSGAVRTWLLEDALEEEFYDQGNFSGRVGVPLKDAHCVDIDDGCTQLFSRGSLYSNRTGGTWTAYGSTNQTELVAAALSQEGYREPAWRDNRFNDWIGDDNAWCEVFVTWAGHASGNPNKVPYDAGWSGYLRKVLESGTVRHNVPGSRIKPGDMLIFAWTKDNPSHVGFAVRVSGGYVYTIEGNTSDGTGDPTRGVFVRKRPLSLVWGVSSPNDYAKAT